MFFVVQIVLALTLQATLAKQNRADVDKICLYVKDPFKLKYQLLMNGKEKIGTENVKNRKAFVDYSQTIDNVY